jgi:hypothetical protein
MMILDCFLLVAAASYLLATLLTVDISSRGASAARSSLLRATSFQNASSTKQAASRYDWRATTMVVASRDRDC